MAFVFLLMSFEKFILEKKLGDKGEESKKNKPHRHSQQYGDYKREREIGGGKRGCRGGKW